MRLLAILILATTCAVTAAPAQRNWHTVKSWACQLQNLNIQQASASPFDLLVIDYSKDGSESQRLTRADVQRLKGPRNRLVLSYLSIGEAETYRWYWQKGWKPGAPRWLEKENPHWEGNFKVRYWDPDWQRIVFAYLDKIMDAGFDGVYLDIVDGYEYWQERGVRDARSRMIDFVAAMASHARVKRGDRDFGVFPQNAEELITDRRFLQAVTGLGREEAYYGYEHDDVATPARVTRRIESFLDRAVKSQRLVLCLDYCTSPAKIRSAVSRARQRGYVPYCATRGLDRLMPPR